MKNMHNIRFKKPKVGKIFIYIFMICLVSFTVLPLIYVVSTSLKPMNELFLFPPRFFVTKPTLNNFADLLGALTSIDVPFSRYVVNSVVVTVVNVLLTIIISSMGAYGLAKHKPQGSKFILAVVIAALMFAPQVTIIPSYLVVNKLHLINNLFSLILPKVAGAFSFFLMEQFIRQIPDPLIEAARIDGAKEFKIYWKIILPCVKPALATLTVFAFIGSWNDYMTPLIYINSEANKTIPLALQLIAGGAGAANLSRAGAVAAATFLMTLPTIIIFVIMQSKVIETMTHSGIKA